MSRSVLYIIALSLCFSGCTRVYAPDDRLVSCIVANRIDAEVAWRQGCEQDEQAFAFIEWATANELSPDTAIQIALLNNPVIQAIFEELGIAQADLIEAGLLSNPSFEIEIRYPDQRGLHTNIEYLITSSLLDIFLIPLRTRLSATAFEQTKLRVSNEILELAFEVRETFYELVGEESKIVYLKSLVELTSIESELATKQFDVGNVNTLELQFSQSRALEAMLEFEQSQTNAIRLREKLHRLLGLPGGCLILSKNLPDIDLEELDLCKLESTALENRLDLQIAQLEVQRISQMLGMKKWWAYTGLRAGLAGEKDPDGTNLVGPGFSGEIPIFNYGQAARMRLMAELRQAQDRLDELEIKVLSQVREAYMLLSSYQKIIKHYKSDLLKLQSQISLSSEALYNVMGIGVDKLLENKRLEIVANKNYTESLKKYLVTRVELDRALGGYLSCINP